MKFVWNQLGSTKFIFPITFLVPEKTANEEFFTNPETRPRPSKQHNPKPEPKPKAQVIPFRRREDEERT